jgi:hypothetical protein
MNKSISFPIIIISILRVKGLAIFPFILIQNAADKEDRVLIRHETIHLKQQLEMLIFPFYIIYLLNYLYNLAKFRNHNQAYKEIIFEREAYANERNPSYLANRRFWGFTFYRYDY